ncbi:hypothetical protein GCM10008967_23290 [Bacillus carboniphilus]|uniref:Uncharacterized protein n=1 Tax=Bacillus carboniphilus TaxID=86663 RepID=A0ABP3G1J5_9BACI
MSGHWFWNFTFALFGFLLYFFLSFDKKEPAVLLIQSFLVFILFYLIIYIVRFLWTMSVEDPTKDNPQEEMPTKETEQHLEMLELTKQLEKEDVEKVVAYIREQFQKETK